MYFYIFDPGKDKEGKYFERVQGKLLNLLSEHHIEGDNYRTTSIRTVELLTEQAISGEAKTLVVVGSDASLSRAINTVIRKKADLTLGFVPLDAESVIGRILGIPADIEMAIKIIASRLIVPLNLGRLGEFYFLTKVDLGENPLRKLEAGLWGLKSVSLLTRLQPFVVKISLEDSFTASSEVLAAQIINSRDNTGCHMRLGDPTDELLDVVLLNKLSRGQIFRYRKELASGCLDNVPGVTVMHAKKIDILGPRKLPLSIEGQVYTKAPASISVASEKIRLIVGKGRQF